jgi:ATP-dependent helicase/nuclease subunit B
VDPFLTQLADLCRTHPTRAKWVFVPSHGIGRTLGERLVLEGTNWANLRFVTPLDIALRMGAPFLVERGIDPSGEGLGPALIMRLLLGLSGEHTYYRPLVDRPSMARALWETVHELRMAGIRARDIAADAFESEAKHAELRALLAAYERYLVESARGDMATVYEEAMAHPDWCPIQPSDCWTGQPGVLWAPLQRRLIDTMPGERTVPRTYDIPGLEIPRRLRDAVGEMVAPDASTSPLAFLLAPEQAALISPVGMAGGPSAVVEAVVPGPGFESGNMSAASSRVVPGFSPANPGGAVTAVGQGWGGMAFRAGGREAEVEEVCRRILASGAPLDRIEIACAFDEYATLIWEKACRHDWPVTIATGMPAGLTRPGRALLAWCDWIEGRFAAADLRHLLQSGDVTLDLPVDLSPGRAARLLIRAEATWGRATYGLALARLAAEYRQKAEDAERSEEQRESARESLESCDALNGWIQGLLEAVPEPDRDGLVSLLRLTGAAEAFLEICSARTSALDGAARVALLDELAELHALDDLRCRPVHGLGFIRERVAGSAVARDRPRPGHLHISRLARSGHAGRAHLFVVGLEEGRVFPSRAEDPVLLDVERAAISPLLRTSHDRLDELQYQTVMRLAASGSDPRLPSTTVTFSYSCRDTREYRETLPSWLLLQAGRVIAGDAALTYDDLAAHLGEPVSSIAARSDEATTESGWWLAGVRRAPGAGRRRVMAHFQHVAGGVEARAGRASDRFTGFDGCAPAAGAALDPLTTGRQVSATMLEDAAVCPQRFFLRRGLRVDPVPDADRDRDAWLDPRLRGAELHDLYAVLMRRCRSESRRPDPEQDRWMVDRADQRLEELRREVPPPSPEVFERERRDFLRDVELFVRHEAAWDGGEPVGLEVSFGRPLESSDGREPLARADAVRIDLGSGRTLLLGGRIDRVDRVGRSLYDVVDYKSGGYWSDRWKGTFAGGTRLQHALYGLAVVELLKTIDPKARIRNGVYFFTSARGGQERCEIPRPDPRVTRRVLSDLLDVIARGAFVHTADEGDCEFCDYHRACGAGAASRAAVKLENTSERLLDGYRRLTEHE